MYDVVALGEVIVDFTTVANLSEKENINPVYEMNPGGAPANVLAAVSGLGGRTAFIGMVGDDCFGHFLKEKLDLAGICTSGMKSTKEASTALAFVHLDAKGDRSFSFYRNPGADTRLRDTDLTPGLIENTRIFHFGSVSLTDEPSRSTTLKAARRAREKGALISYDPNWRPPLWKSGDMAKKKMREALSYTDILKISGTEMELLTGEMDPELGSSILFDTGIKLVIVTLGPKGCYYRFAGGAARAFTYDTCVVDTTGAGDAFIGGLLYRISRHGKALDDISRDEMDDMIDFSNAMGALCASKRGAIPAMPSMNDLALCRQMTRLLAY